MRRSADLTGRHFGRLVAKRLASKKGRAKWECQCSCGNRRIIFAQALITGNTQSCGCWRTEASKEERRKRRAGASVAHRYTIEEAIDQSLLVARAVAARIGPKIPWGRQ